MATSDKFMPGSDADSVEIFSYPFFIEKESKEFIECHGKIMFIIRGPPGTGKKSLTDLIMYHFPTGQRCSADDYFRNTFNSSVRTKESLKESHMYCHQRVKQECEKNAHPIIVSNTHMKKREMQEYLNFAMEYEYTIIITSTCDKFKVSPEILAKSNTKNLDENYFRKRLQQWEDVFPILMGWFLCPDDSFYLLQQLQFALDALLGDGRFCRVFNAFDSGTLLNRYKAKKMLCSVAGFIKGNPYKMEEYYKSVEVQDSCGKCFTICIPGFVVIKSDIFAIVELDYYSEELLMKSNFENCYNEENDDDMNHIINSMQVMSVESSYNFKLVSLKNDFSQMPTSAILKENSSDHINIHKSSFIHLAETKVKPFSAWKLNNLFMKSFTGVIEQNGEINITQFNELEGGYAMCRLHKDGWVIKLPKLLSVKTVFTGLYI